MQEREISRDGVSVAFCKIGQQTAGQKREKGSGKPEGRIVEPHLSEGVRSWTQTVPFPEWEGDMHTGALMSNPSRFPYGSNGVKLLAVQDGLGLRPVGSCSRADGSCRRHGIEIVVVNGLSRGIQHRYLVGFAQPGGNKT